MAECPQWTRFAKHWRIAKESEVFYYFCQPNCFSGRGFSASKMSEIVQQIYEKSKF